jgi:hypothetical protein
MKGLRLIIFITFFFAPFSCKKTDNGTKLAQVYDEILYLEDVIEIIPDNISEEDSMMILQNKIDLWVRKQTMLRRAELHMADHLQEIDEIVEEYRASLMIEKYKQEYIKQKMDTMVLTTEVESYYNNYPESFILTNDIVKVNYHKYKADSKQLIQFKNLFYSDKLEDKKEAVDFSKEHASSFNDFENNWVEMTLVSNLLPANFKLSEVVLNAGNKIETRNNEYYFFIDIENYRLKGQKIPFDQVKDRIKTIILNKRKLNLINELENKIYQSDLKNGNIKIFVE